MLPIVVLRTPYLQRRRQSKQRRQETGRDAHQRDQPHGRNATIHREGECTKPLQGGQCTQDDPQPGDLHGVPHVRAAMEDEAVYDIDTVVAGRPKEHGQNTDGHEVQLETAQRHEACRPQGAAADREEHHADQPQPSHVQDDQQRNAQERQQRDADKVGVEQGSRCR